MPKCWSVLRRRKARAKDAQGVSPPGYLIYGLGSPEDGNYMELCARRGEEISADNQDDGPNWDFMGRMAVVAAYQFWEDHYREQIAKHLCIAKKEFEIPIFGDLRRFRRCIIHNGARWAGELRKVECFEWEEVGDTEGSDEIHFPRSIIISIWHHMRLALHELKHKKAGV